MEIIILPILFLCLFFTLGIFQIKLYNKVSIREISVTTWLVYFLFVNIVTEALSLFNAIAIYLLFIIYVLFALLLVAIIIKERRFVFQIYLHAKSILANINYWLLGGMMFVFIFTGFIAIYSAPNNWDSMTYHLGRVVHWIQNGNIEYYSTHINRQLFNPPLAEYTLMHFYLLGNGDHWVNLLQYFSFIQCAIGISLITRELGCNFKAQLYASFIMVVIPMAILQCTNTKNELTLSFFVVIAFYFLLRYLTSSDKCNIFFCGLASGLAFVTKGTSYIYLFPVFLVYLSPIPVKTFFLKAKAGIIIGFVSLLVATPLFVRNYKSYKHPLGATRWERNYYKNDEISFRTTVSNVSRNVFIQLANDYLFDDESIFKKKAEWLKVKVIELHKKMSIDVADPKTTWHGTGLDYSISRDEDYAGNFLHFAIVCIAIVFIMFRAKYFLTLNEIHKYIFMIIFVFIFFCVYLKWQPWHSRLHLPIFILSVPIIAVFINELNKYLATAILLLLFIGSLSYVFENGTRSLCFKDPIIYRYSRDEIMFIKKGNMPMLDCYELTDYIAQNNIKSLGLILNGDGWDYPIWHIVKRKSPFVKISHVNVPESVRSVATLQNLKQPLPQVIFSTEQNHAKTLTSNGIQYKLLKQLQTGDIYIR